MIDGEHGIEENLIIWGWCHQLVENWPGEMMKKIKCKLWKQWLRGMKPGPRRSDNIVREICLDQTTFPSKLESFPRRRPWNRGSEDDDENTVFNDGHNHLVLPQRYKMRHPFIHTWIFLEANHREGGLGEP